MERAARAFLVRRENLSISGWQERSRKYGAVQVVMRDRACDAKARRHQGDTDGARDLFLPLPGESAWESNPPAQFVTPPNGFEDRGSHRATGALSRGL